MASGCVDVCDGLLDSGGGDVLVAGVHAGEHGGESDVLDEAWHAACVLEEDGDGVWLEEILRGTGSLEMTFEEERHLRVTQGPQA